MENEILTNLAKAVKEFDTAGAEDWAPRAMAAVEQPGCAEEGSLAQLRHMTALHEVFDGGASWR